MPHRAKCRLHVSALARGRERSLNAEELKDNDLKMSSAPAVGVLIAPCQTTSLKSITPWKQVPQNGPSCQINRHL